jgi:hypothetical protein
MLAKTVKPATAWREAYSSRANHSVDSRRETCNIKDARKSRDQPTNRASVSRDPISTT